MGEKGDGVSRIQGRQDLGIFEQVPCARGAQQDEPKRHDRPEEASDARAASALDHEETDQDGGS